MKLAGRTLPRPTVRHGVIAAVALIWAVTLVTVAVPSWRRVVRQHDEIATLERQLDDLDRWTVAGLWLERAVASREPAVNAAWARLFPSERSREELFLDLARVADRSGVEAFALEEMNDMGMSMDDVWSATDAPEDDMAPPDDAPPTDDGMAPMDVAVAPTVDLDSYRVKATFAGDYARTAAFLGGLIDIERALDVHSLVVRPSRDGILVEMELDIYVSGTTDS